MNYPEIVVLVLAAVAIAYRGWVGWRYGAAYEIRPTLMLLFGVLAAIRYWQIVTSQLMDAVTFDPRWVAIGAFLSIFIVACVVAGFIVKVKAQCFKSVQQNYLDNLLGLAAGLFSGALLGACIIWLSTVAIPGNFDSVTYAQSFLRFPRVMVQAIEKSVGVAPGSEGRVHYPEVKLIEVPVAPGETDVVAPPGSVLMRHRGQIAWK